MESKALVKKADKITINTSRILWGLSIAAGGSIILYYLWIRGFIYLNFSQEVYTDYFWYRAPWLLVHVICGLIATLVGPLQFVKAFRKRYLKVHRALGVAYLVSIAISTFVSFYLASTAQLGIVYATGLRMLGIVWFITTAMAYLAIVRRNLKMHNEWMIKSYVLTLSFVSFRFVEDLLAAMDISSFVDRKVLLAWGSWVIPFFLTVVILQLIRLFKTSKA